MPPSHTPVNQIVPTRLKRGTATRLAARTGLSLHHVNEVARGRRTGSPELERLIAAEYRKLARSAARKLARAADRLRREAEAELAQGASLQKSA